VNVAILSIGDEVLEGRIVDTNAAWISAEAAGRGARVTEQATVGDDRTRIADTLRRLAASADVVIATGGLGPTSDDLSRDALADATDDGMLEIDADSLVRLKAWCRDRGLPATEARVEVVKRPPSAQHLDNDCGTAPGLRVRLGTADCWLLPGPPEEMRSMARRHLLPSIERVAARLRTMEVLAAGLTEVQAAELLGSTLDRQHRPRLGIRVGGGLVRVAVEDVGGDVTRAEMVSVADAVRSTLSPWALADGCETLAEAVGQSLQARDATLATAESCTGGGIGAALTSIAGSSAWYRGGWVTYTNGMKHGCLGVPTDRFSPGGPGAVSDAVVRDMADGARQRSGADVAVAVSGIAGPSGGTPEKPVGTVWVGLAEPGGVHARLLQVPGDRRHVRAGTTDAALLWCRWWAEGVSSRLPWERST